MQIKKTTKKTVKKTTKATKNTQKKDTTTKKAYWEVLFPEPIVVDAKYDDDFLIYNMVNMNNSTEFNRFIEEITQQPTKFSVLYCSEKELLSLFKPTKELKFEITHLKGSIVIFIKDKKGNTIGRGEVIRLGKKMTVPTFKKQLANHLIGFADRFANGQIRMQNINAKMKVLQSKINNNQNELN